MFAPASFGNRLKASSSWVCDFCASVKAPMLSLPNLISAAPAAIPAPAARALNLSKCFPVCSADLPTLFRVADARSRARMSKSRTDISTLQPDRHRQRAHLVDGLHEQHRLWGVRGVAPR